MPLAPEIVTGGKVFGILVLIVSLCTTVWAISAAASDQKAAITANTTAIQVNKEASDKEFETISKVLTDIAAALKEQTSATNELTVEVKVLQAQRE